MNCESEFVVSERRPFTHCTARHWENVQQKIHNVIMKMYLEMLENLKYYSLLLNDVITDCTTCGDAWVSWKGRKWRCTLLS